MQFDNSDDIQSKVLEKGKAQDDSQNQQRWLDEILNSSKDSLPLKPNDTSARVSDLLNSLNKARSGERPAEVQIADILSRNNDFGNDVKKARVNEMFREAMEKGPKAVDKLITNINKELEKSGSGLRLEGKPGFTIKDIQSDRMMNNKLLILGHQRQENVKLILTNKHGETEDVFIAEGRKERIPSDLELRFGLKRLLEEPGQTIISENKIRSGLSQPIRNPFDQWQKYNDSRENWQNDKKYFERKFEELKLDRPFYKVPPAQMPILNLPINRNSSIVTAELRNRIVWP